MKKIKKLRSSAINKSATFHFEAQLGYQGVAGIDEAGYGAWAGPVAVCAVMLNVRSFPEELQKIVYDSKHLKIKMRTLIHDIFVSNPEYGVSYVEMVWPEEIHQLNVLNATLCGMERALLKFVPQPSHALIDGPRRIPFLSKDITQHPIIKGDQKSYSIAMASIIAKVQRDLLMKEMHQQYPLYGWDTNKGYGTKKHEEALKMFGCCPYHRKGYKIKGLQTRLN
ncbi:ribonuclease HII [Holospora obtusa F1]|uniref:Ribonuclease n=1 Tax=Holospora obtusa F1 TaxID=1399147 RepID=W6TT81_HOLOB|nr:ribonuclease HII [Holospora obtusa]ETZ06977.1 ribonuclease HII [Holospora obtusa F1]